MDFPRSSSEFHIVWLSLPSLLLRGMEPELDRAWAYSAVELGRAVRLHQLLSQSCSRAWPIAGIEDL